MTTWPPYLVSRVDGRYEPGNGTSYALAALRLHPGQWPGTHGLTFPVLVTFARSSYVFELGEGTLHSRYVADSMRVGPCDGAALLRWLEEFPGAEFEAVIQCSCGRHGGDNDAE